MTTGLVGLFVLFLLLILGIAVLAGVISAIHHRRWGVLIGLGAVTLLPILLIFLSFVGYQQVRSDFGGTPYIEELGGPSPVAVKSRAERLLAEAATEADSPPLTPPAPSIQLDAETPTAKADATADGVSEIKTDTERPGWVDGDITADQKLFTSGPFATVEQCRDDARKQLAHWVWSHARGDDSEALPRWGVDSSEVEGRFNQASYLEKRETSVGDVYLLYTLGEIDDNDDAQWLADRVDFWVTKSRREQGLNRVVIGGGILLGAVGLLHGVLRSGVRDRKS